MKKGIRVIDVEHHFATVELFDAYYGLFGRTFENDGLPEKTHKEHVEECDIDELMIKRMDEAGIDFSQLSFTTPGSEYFEDIEVGKRLATDSNNKAAATIKKHPDRLGAYMSLVPDDVEWSLKEMDRCISMGLWGWCTMSNYGGRSRLDDPKYLPLLKRCNELKMPIFLHPMFPVNKEINEVGYALEGPVYGFTADTQLTFLRMMLRGVFDKLPDLKIILGHNAEGFAIYIDRIDTGYRQGMGQPYLDFGKIDHEPSYYLRHNLVGDTSGSFSSDVLNFTKQIFGPDFLVFGSDYPYENTKASVDLVLNDKNLTFEEKKAILQDNAQALGFGVR